MTYLFKLASRISRLRTALPLLLLSALACAKGEKVEFLGPNPGPAAPKLTTIRIEPKVTSAQVGTTVKFTATGYSATGYPIPVSIDWIAQGGSITAAGLYTAETAGQFTILARARENAAVTDSAAVGVWNAPSDQVALIISPDSALIEEGDSINFSAAVQLANGDVAGDALVQWFADGGLITPSGKFVISQSGVYTVSAVTPSGLRGWAKVFVRVKSKLLQRISLSPKTSTVTAGSTTAYTATGQYSDGSSAQPSVQWSATGGSINSAGVYTAGSSGGSYRVVAQNAQGSVADTAAVTISAPSVVGITISPKTVTLQPAATASFSGLARLSDGSFAAAAANWQATGGTISASGAYVAGATTGTYRAIVTAAGVPGADTATINIVQPVATLTGIILNPATVSLGSGQTRQFAVTGVWSDGSSSAPPVSWNATGGSVSTGGLYTAGSTPGTFRVIAAAAGGKADTSQVTVLPAVLTGLTLTPPTGAVLAGQTLQFSVAGIWSDGSATAPSVTWNVAGGTISSGWLYTAGNASGTHQVIATQQGGTLADTSLVTISQPAPVLTGIGVSPGSVVLAQGGIQQFSAVALWSDGSTSTPGITWTATGGTVNSSGRYTAGSTAGTFRIIGRLSSGTMADTSSIVITAPPIVTNLTISPKSTTSQLGTSTQFAASATWSNGTTSLPPLTWTGTGGTVNSTGLYAAGSTAGTYRVIVAHQGGVRRDTASVTLTATPPPPPPPTPTLSSLAISPKPTSVPTGQTRQFSASGTWSDGSTTAPAVTWSATGGSITASGLYSAGPAAGTFRVIGQHQGGTLADTSTVSVTGAGAVLNNLSISPKPASVVAGAQIQFAAAAQWSDGSTGLPTLTWSSTGGTMHLSGLYLAGSAAGTFRVVVSGGGKADTSAVTVTAPPAGTPVVTSFVLTPGSASLQTGGAQQFGTTATWSDGVSRPVTVSYSATGGTVSASGLYAAGSIVGTFAVIASCGCGMADTATVNLTASTGAVLTNLTVNPKSASLFLGGGQQFSVSAQWSDGGSAVPPITWTATGGTVSTGGYYTGGMTGGTYRVIASGGSKADTAAVTLAGSPPPAGSSCPNKPAGMTTITDERWDALPNPLGGADQGWGYWGSLANLTTIQDVNAPHSAPNVLRIKWPQGSPGGSGTVGIAATTSVSYKTIYHCFWMKVASGFTMNGNVGMKWGFSQTAYAGTPNYSHYYIMGFGGTDGYMGVDLEGSGLNRNTGTSFKWTQNYDRWHQVEVLTVAETSQSGSDGIIRFWIDGNLDYQITNVRFFQPQVAPIGWRDFNINGTYGGGLNPVPYDMYVFLDNYFIAGK